MARDYEPTFKQSGSYGSSVNAGGNYPRTDDTVTALSKNLSVEFDKIATAAKASYDPYVNKSLDLIKLDTTNPESTFTKINANFTVLDNKVRILEKNISVNNKLLEYNKRLVEKTNDIIRSSSRDVTYKKFSDIENAMEEKALHSIIDSRIDDILKKYGMARGSASSNQSSGLGGGFDLMGMIGQRAGSSMLSGAGSAAKFALPLAARAAGPLAAAGGLAWILNTKEGQDAAIDFAKSLDDRKKQLKANQAKIEAEEAQYAKLLAEQRARDEEHRRRMTTEYRMNFPRPQSMQPNMFGRGHPTLTSAGRVQAGMMGRGQTKLDQDPIDWSWGYDFTKSSPNAMSNSEPDFVDPEFTGEGLKPATVNKNTKVLPNVEDQDIEITGEGLKPATIGPNTRVIPNIEDTVSPSAQYLQQRNRGVNATNFRIHSASLGNDLDFLSPETRAKLFGSDTIAPNLSTLQELSSSKAKEEDPLKNYEENFNFYYLTAKEYTLNAERVEINTRDRFDLTSESAITITSKQRIVFDAPIIEIRGGMTKGSSSQSGSSTYNPGNAGTYTGSSDAVRGGRGTGFSPGSSIPTANSISGKGGDRLGATGPDGKPVAKDAQALLDFIADSEGADYNTQYGYQNTTGGKPLTSMTIEEIREAQRAQNGSSAIGRYQFMAGTVDEMISKGIIKPGDKFDQATQDKMAMHLLREKRGMDKWLSGSMSDKEFATGLSQEWASIPNPDTGQGYYGGQNSKHSSADLDRILASGLGTGYDPLQSKLPAGVKSFGTEGTPGLAPVELDNKNATRNQAPTSSLSNKLSDAVFAVYGSGYKVQVYSGGQDAAGEGGPRVGTTRHDHGHASDVYVVGPDGKRVTGDKLAPLAQYWQAKGYGGTGLEMHGGGIHLDEHTDRATSWDYAAEGGSITPAQQQAIEAGKKGILPEGLHTVPNDGREADIKEKSGRLGRNNTKQATDNVDVKTSKGEILTLPNLSLDPPIQVNSSVVVNPTTVVQPPVPKPPAPKNSHDGKNLSASGLPDYANSMLA